MHKKIIAGIGLMLILGGVPVLAQNLSPKEETAARLLKHFAATTLKLQEISDGLDKISRTDKSIREWANNVPILPPSNP